MSEEKTANYKPHVRELAARIFVELAAKAVTLEPGRVSIAASADNIATTCFKLAEAFQAVEDKLNAPNVARSEFKLSADDIAGWSTK
jgi:hypothetical protein